jgi:anti-sigma B factor antagonist
VNLALEEEELEGLHVIAVVGELDVATAPRLNKRVNVAVADGAGGVLVDLCDVGFIDSMGLHVLIHALRQLTRRERRLMLVCPPGAVERALSQTGIRGMFEIFHTRADAVRAHRQRR